MKSTLFKRIVTNPPKPAGWILLRSLLEVRTRKEIFTPENSFAYINIDDWTEDFDFPKDLEAWKENRPS
jgi:hypothetical protein